MAVRCERDPVVKKGIGQRQVVRRRRVLVLSPVPGRKVSVANELKHERADQRMIGAIPGIDASQRLVNNIPVNRLERKSVL